MKFREFEDLHFLLRIQAAADSPWEASATGIYSQRFHMDRGLPCVPSIHQAQIDALRRPANPNFWTWAVNFEIERITENGRIRLGRM